MTADTALPVLRRRTAPMALLAQGVPLSLLLDLACGPRSEELLREEPAPPGRGPVLISR